MKHDVKIVAISVILTLVLSGGLHLGSFPSAIYAAEAVPCLAIAQGTSTGQLVPQSAPTPPSQRLARFDEATGAFSVRYPADLSRIRSLDAPDIYGYTFTNEAASTTFAVGFLVISETDLSEGEWRVLLSAMGPQGLMRKLGGRFDNPAFVEVARELGEAGTHQLYWEGEYEEAEDPAELLHSALFAQEATGILAITAVVTTQEDWAARRTLFLEAFKSLEWSSEVVRAQAGGTAIPAETSPAEETVEPEEIPEATTPTEEATALPEESPESAAPTEEATATPEEGDKISPEIIIESVFPEETEEAETPTAKETPEEVPGEVDVIMPEETPEEEITPKELAEETTTPGDETVTFEDPNSVFELTYPAAFDAPEGPYLEDEGYIYVASMGGDENYFVGVYFQIIAKKALSDAQWKKAVDPMVQNMLEQVGQDAVEVYREEGKRGQHWLYFEAESEAEDARMLFYTEEASGVLAILMARIPPAEWPDWEESLLDVVRSFRWWPDAAREVLSGESAEPSVKPTPTRARATPTPKSAQPAIPAGKGGLVMLNCRGDVVTVDVIPDGVFQELAPKTGEQCYRGKPIYLDPGEYILKASIAGVPSQGEATITISGRSMV
ncbi:MAG: hypothetical protein ACP5R2_05830 [Anaerolineae bacterium]